MKLMSGAILTPMLRSCDFNSYVREFRENSEADGSVEDYWRALKGVKLDLPQKE